MTREILEPNKITHKSNFYLDISMWSYLRLRGSLGVATHYLHRQDGSLDYILRSYEPTGRPELKTRYIQPDGSILIN